MRRVLATVAIVLGTNAVRADGVYFSQTIGIGRSSTLGRPVQTRASIGARVRWLAIESWAASDSQASRDGATWGLIGGEPRMRSDLDSYGVGARGIVPLHRTQKVTLEGYLRTSAGLASANGELDGYRGRMLGVGGGLQIRGQVRVLGYVWGPLFLVNRGPHVTGALFVDQGYDRLVLRSSTMTVRTGISHTVLGFSIGSTF